MIFTLFCIQIKLKVEIKVASLIFLIVPPPLPKIGHGPQGHNTENIVNSHLIMMNQRHAIIATEYDYVTHPSQVDVVPG